MRPSWRHGREGSTGAVRRCDGGRGGRRRGEGGGCLGKGEEEAAVLEEKVGFLPLFSSQASQPPPLGCTPSESATKRSATSVLAEEKGEEKKERKWAPDSSRVHLQLLSKRARIVCATFSPFLKREISIPMWSPVPLALPSYQRGTTDAVPVCICDVLV